MDDFPTRAEKKPKDLGIKIGTPREVLWTNVKKVSEQDVLSAKNEIEINEKMIKVAEEIIKEEQAKK